MNIFAFVLEVIDDEVKAKVHENCRISFKNRIVRKEEPKRKYDIRKKKGENKIELKRERANDVFNKTSHLMAAIRRKVEEKLSYITSRAHKEVSAGSRMKHDYTIRDLTNQLKQFFDQFVDGPARDISSLGFKLMRISLMGL